MTKTFMVWKKTETKASNHLSFHLDLNAADIYYAEIEMWHCKKQ